MKELENNPRYFVVQHLILWYTSFKKQRLKRMEGLSWVEVNPGKIYLFIHLFSILQRLVLYRELSCV